MVLGFLIATGIETVFELSFWSIRTISKGIYYSVYGNKEHEQNNSLSAPITQIEYNELRNEISELKKLLKQTKPLNNTHHHDDDGCGRNSPVSQS